MKTVQCSSHLFPPEGKGIGVVEKSGIGADKLVERLKPILTKEFIRR